MTPKTLKWKNAEDMDTCCLKCADEVECRMDFLWEFGFEPECRPGVTCKAGETCYGCSSFKKKVEE